MANLVDTSVNGDLRVTGTMFGTQAGNYATCATAAGTAAKAVTISGFTLTTGIHVFVKFTVTNAAAVASLTLNVSGTGAKAMKYRGGNLPAVETLSASRVYEFIYDGTNWELVGDLDTFPTLPLSVENGGTGATTAADAANNILSALPVWTTAPTDNVKLIRRDLNDGAEFGQVTFLTMWNYIKGKISSVLGLTKTAYGGNAATATKATQDSDGNAINATYFKSNAGTTTLQSGAAVKVGTQNGADVKLQLPAIPTATATTPKMDGTAAVGSETTWAKGDHVHPSDTSREAVSNKTTVILGTSDSKYPTDKAVADFVNSSVATNTANYISNDGQPFTSVAQLEAYVGTVTNNDYAFVTGTDSAGNTYYDRYKATVSGSTVTWSLEYRLNNSSFTSAQWEAINSGITAALVGKIHEHANKAVLDGITATDVSNWNNKLDKNGDGSDVKVGFTEAANRTNIATGSKLSTLFGQIRKWLADLKALAFKDKVGASDVDSGTYNIDISGNAATLATPRKIDGVEFDGSGDIIHYGECNTAANVQAKVISCPGFVLTTGARIIIKFTNNNNFREPTFNVNDTGAVPVRYFGSLLPVANFLRSGAVYQFVYDGTNYCFVGNFDNNNYAYQTALSYNAEYPVLCKNNANQTAENNYVRYASGITMNPSTNKITASGGFVGDLSGNAATASEAASGSTLESKINSKQDDLGISSSGSSTKFLNEQGEWTTVTAPDVSNKLDKDGLGDDVRVQFTQATTRTNIVTTSKLSVLFGQIRKWLADLKALAFKDKVGVSDVESGTYPIDISGNAATATTATTATSATTASATSSGSISGGDDLNSYNTANRNYLCSAKNASTVTNKPSGASGAFELEVIRGTGSSCVQIYYSRDTLNFNYIRKCTGLNNNEWTAWDRLSLVSDASFSAVNKSENTTDGCTLTFTAIDGSTKSVTVRNVVNAGNADTVDGYHIVVGSTGTKSNTIYFT